MAANWLQILAILGNGCKSAAFFLSYFDGFWTSIFT